MDEEQNRALTREYENQCEAALLLSAGIPKDKAAGILKVLARTGEQSLNTWNLPYIMKLYEVAAAGVHFSVLGNVPYTPVTQVI